MDSVARPRETMRGLPRALQGYLTWVTGIPLEGERPIVRWTPARAGLLGACQIAAGVALGASALHPFRAWSLPCLLLSWLITAGGMRRLDVVVVHQTLHRMVTRAGRRDRLVAEIITTLMWRMPYEENRKEHLLHHRYPCSMKDGDTRYLLSTGMRPGMSRPEFHRYLLGALLSPAHHWRFFSSRIRANFVGVRPRSRLAMSLVFLAATIGFLACTGLWLEWLVLWVLPLSFFFQAATFLYTQTEHRWWVFANAEKLTKEQRDFLTFGRMCGDPAPGPEVVGAFRRAAAWARWWLRLFFVHSTYRMFVLVGDTLHHDLHHIHPGCDWPNSDYERVEKASGSTRYSEVWGSLIDHLYAAGMVRGPTAAESAAPPIDAISAQRSEPS